MTARAVSTGAAATAGLLSAVLLTGTAQAATTWTVPTTPNSGTVADELYGVKTVSPTSAWAVGSWYDASRAAPRTLVQRWNGTSWATVASPNATNFYNELQGVDATSASDAWAVGYANGSSGVNGTPRNTLALHWNGTAWSTVATPNPGVATRQLYAVRTFSPTDAWAVGWYYEASFTAEALVLHWNGTSWTQVDVATPGTTGNFFDGIAGVAANDVWAVGHYTDAGDARGLTHPLAMHYDGTTWTNTPLPPTTAGGYLRAVTALASGDVWAVGSKNGYSTPVAYHWNGTVWSEVPTAPLAGGTGNNLFYGVTGTATGTGTGTGQVWAVGYQSTGNGPQPLVQRWTGTAFVTEPLPTLAVGGSLYAASAVAGPTVFAAGTQQSLDSGSRTDRTLSMRGNGS